MYFVETTKIDAHDSKQTIKQYKEWLATGRWFSPGTPVSSTNKTNPNDITEILLKVALSTTNHI